MSEEYCCFLLGSYSFLISIKYSLKVLIPKEFTPIPLAPPQVQGFINYRGQVITILKLANILQITANPPQQQQVLLLQYQNLSIGVLVDRVLDVFSIDNTLFEPVSREIPSNIQYYLTSGCCFQNQQYLQLSISSLLEPTQ